MPRASFPSFVKQVKLVAYAMPEMIGGVWPAGMQL